jgi:type IV pilus assembly protein PilO
MATAFKDWPWPLQALFYLGLTVVIIAAGFYIPGLPLASVRAQLQDAQKQEKPLEQEVANLRVYKQRRAELQSQMDALQKQLATLQTIVPEEKQVDQFILMIQSAATSSGVSLRRLKANPVGTKPYYFELPFEVQADGPYFSVLDFFSRLGRRFEIRRSRQKLRPQLPAKPGSFGYGDVHHHHVLYEVGRCSGANYHVHAGCRTGKAVG